MYLEPIFASEDIGKTLPEELTMFQSVDGLWRVTMEAVEENAVLNDVLDRDNILTQFVEANKNLAEI
jgi:hypothetical protein